MRAIFFFLAAFTLLCATMTVELEEKEAGIIGYELVERGALNSNLTLVVKEVTGNISVQHTVQKIEGFNGLLEGEFVLLETGRYTVTVFNENTGAIGQAEIEIRPRQAPPELEQEIEDQMEEFVVGQSSLEIAQEDNWLLPVLIALLIGVIIVLLLFGNPFKAKHRRR